MDLSNIPPDLLQKLEKLLALKDGAESVGNTHEAEAAAGRVTALLMKHNLGLFEAQTEIMKRKILAQEEEFDLNDLQSKTEAEWVLKLFNVIATHNMCKCIHHIKRRQKYDQGTVGIIGTKTNIEITYYVVDQLINKIKIAHRLAWKIYQTYGTEKANTFKRGFLVGAVAGIASKLAQVREEVEQEIKLSGAQHAENMQLMVIANKDAIQKYTEEAYPDLRKTKGRKLSGADGKRKGYESGSNMNIQQGMGSSKPKGLLGN